MKYRNTSNQELMVIGVGIVPAGATVDINVEFSNPNFQEVTEPTPVAHPVAPVKPPEAPVPPTEQANQD